MRRNHSTIGTCYVCGTSRPLHTMTIVPCGINSPNTKGKLCSSCHDKWLETQLSPDSLRMKHNRFRLTQETITMLEETDACEVCGSTRHTVTGEQIHLNELCFK